MNVFSVRSILTGVLAAGLMLFSSLLTAPVQAATLTITTSDPIIAPDGNCSLREAIINANNDNQSGSVDCAAGSGADTIEFNQVTVLPANSFAYYAYEDTAFPAITTDIRFQNGTIDGSGGDSFRLLHVTDVGSLTLNAMTIQNGGGTNTGSGAGIHSHGSLTIENSIFDNNIIRSGSVGGAVVVRYDTSTLTVRNSTFTNNNGADGGGAIYSLGTVTVENSTFTGNNGRKGGALYNNSGTMTVTDSSFDSNSGTDGGAIHNAQTGTLTVERATLTNNTTSSTGGAIYSARGSLTPGPDSVLTVLDSTISGNTADDNGGGVYLRNTLATIKHTPINGNSAEYGGGVYVIQTEVNRMNLRFELGEMRGNTASRSGGGLYQSDGWVDLVNSPVTGNIAYTGGALWLLDGRLNVTNATIAGNNGTNGSGFIRNDSGTLTIYNTIVYGNSSDYTNINGASMHSEYNIFEYSKPGTGTLSLDPDFIAPLSFGLAPTTGGDYRLQAVSPAIDSGSNTRAKIAGIDPGDPDYAFWRYQDDAYQTDTGEGSAPIIERGFYEFSGRNCQNYEAAGFAPYVIGTVNPDLDSDLSSALYCAHRNTQEEEVIDLNGRIVSPTQVYIDKAGDNAFPPIATTLTLQNGTLDASQGADMRFFHVDATGHLTLRNMVLQHGATVIPGSSFYSGGAIRSLGTLIVEDSVFQYNTSANSSGAIDSRGVTTIHNTSFIQNTAVSNGGAIFNLASLTVTDSLFRDNQSDAYGGAINNTVGSLTVSNSVFSGNQSLRNGGAIDTYSDVPAFITGSTFEQNSAYAGGALSVSSRNDQPVTIDDNQFTGNTASNGGGAISNDTLTFVSNSIMTNNTAPSGGGIKSLGNLTITNSIIADNEATTGGGGISSLNYPLILVNSLVTGNTSPRTGGIRVLYDELTAINSIITNNGTQIGGINATVIDVTYSIVEGGYTGIGNIDADPQFVDAANGDYRLADGSIAIDNGSNSAAMTAGIGSIDLDGNPRLRDDVYVLDGGEGTAPIIDIGPYEMLSSSAGLDVNNDGIVSPSDAVYVVNRQSLLDLTADVNGDGSIDSSDLSAIQAALGGTP